LRPLTGKLSRPRHGSGWMGRCRGGINGFRRGRRGHLGAGRMRAKNARKFLLMALGRQSAGVARRAACRGRL